MRKTAKFAVVTATVLGAVVPGAAAAATPAPEYVATIRTAGDEVYRVRLVEQADIDIALRLRDGDPNAPKIPNGRIVRGSADVNTGYTWHIDPKDFAWADFTMEVCDGRPSDVENGILTGDRFCPWNATVVSVRRIG
ncbi:hypothetical protein LX15_000597 [Streptoalloteichus tenebrarius]|uniref:BP74 N-terminal domain-containing protein n=1 Tax=Streptoalloteichus tenebrarius (strain ATCC 17920 / DSM 40477 / JCM 4838 / CBS 697.72 / NBRC 16177 / NCIMB 11028 / NRRL B-12390 / A12253. 1 / ISP 5477) TaxID=1933 RepID=A0ABT1HN29_STRSD|nr:hypothetical protein [Streptoalloteichus tenebrarius]MCP2256914.1 hypothetical protein [Streptoalloteichus tenebrarius]BFF00178.1 hypothetical protein GCM10020241_18530 [Streptoalloteichus tenebrarius]